jgi:hypothetical protein
LSGAASITYTVATAPSADISVPPNDGTGTYFLDQSVSASFFCVEGISGPGLSSCLDSNGSVSPDDIDTSTFGAHTFSVTATSRDGQVGTWSYPYRVANPPTATITSPPSDQTFVVNQVVPTNFSCSDGEGGSGISTCESSNGQASPGSLDTSTPGSFTYNVVASGHDGLSTTTSINYTVLSSLPTASIAAPVSGGTYAQKQLVETSFRCSDSAGGPGISSCLDSNGSPSPGALDTSTVGTHTYSVWARSTDGLYSETSMTYAVTSPPPVPQHGYWLVGSDGGIFTFGHSQFYGSTGGVTLQRSVVGIVPTADRGGYWLVASDGGIFSFGDTQFHGSIPGLGLAPVGSSSPKRLNAPIVGMVPSFDGGGYFLVGSDGGVFAFGDATYEGSCPGIGGCMGAAVAVMPDASGRGYWLVTATGHVYTFGDAQNYGEPGPQLVPITAAVRTPDGKGYWILFSNGVVSTFGDAQYYGAPSGDTGGLNPATAIIATADGAGYWVATANGAVYNYGDAPAIGDIAVTHLNGSIIAGTGF